MSANDPGVVDKVAGRLTLDISPAKAALLDLQDTFKKTFQEMSNQPMQIGQAQGANTFIQDATGAVRTLQQQIRNLQLSFREGALSAEDLFNKVAALKSTYADAFDPTTKSGIGNIDALRQALVNAQNEIVKMQNFELDSERRLAQQQAAIELENAKQSAATQQSTIDTEMKQIKAFYDMKLVSAQDSLAAMERLMTEETQYFIDNQDKRLQALKTVASMEDAISRSSASSIPTFSGGGTGFGGVGGGIGMLGMGSMMAEFAGISMMAQNIRTGIVDITKQQQGLEQVFGTNISSQQQLNQVTNQFIGIAEQYGQSVTSVLDAAKQWGRQYHDVATAQALVHSSTLLAIVDNMDMTTSAQSLEAVMNAMGMSVKNAADAQASSMSIVDKWSNMAHNASISANDLAAGVQNAAGAAKQAGVNLDQLNALVAAGVRNSGLSGSNIGNMWKTVFANISSDTPKIQKAFQELGISMTNADGSMKPVYDLIIEMSAKSQNLDATQKQAMLTITRGVQQYSKFAEAISNVNTITQDYNTSLDSTGAANKYAQEQLHTLAAELQRLQDTIQQMAYNTSSNGLGDFLAGFVRDVTNLIEGIQQLPPAVNIGVASLVGLLTAGKMLSSMTSALNDSFTTLRDSLQFLMNPVGSLSAAWGEMYTRVRTVTTYLAAKTTAMEADTAASEAEVVASTEVVGALEAETVAATEATAAFSALDVVSGGLTLVIGAAVTGLALWATHLGAAKVQADAVAQSVNNLDAQIQQTQQSAQNATQQTANTITQLQNLKMQYEQVQQAMAQAQAGSQAYKNAQANLMGIQQQLIALVGQDAAQTILGSKNKIGAWNDEIQAMVQTQINELTVQNDRLKNEQSFTSGFIAETNKRIDAIMAEATAQAQANNLASNPYSGGNLEAQSALNPNYHAPIDVSGGIADAQRQLLLGAKNSSSASQYGGSTGPLDSTIAQLQSLKQSLELNPNFIPSQLSGDSTGALPPVTSKTKTPSASSIASAYAAPFQNLATDDSNAMQPFLDNVNNTAAAMQGLNTQLMDADNNLKANIGSQSDLNAVVSTYNQYISATKSNQAALTAENNKAHELLNTVNADIAKVNEQFKSGQISAQAHKDALNALNSEWSKLTNTIKSNEQAINSDNKAMDSATKTITSEITATLKQAYTDQQQIEDQRLANIYQPEIDALTAQKDAVDQLIKSLDDQYAIEDAQAKLAQDQKNLNTEMTQNKSYRVVNADGSISWTYDTAKVQQMQDQVLKDQRDVQKTELQQQSDNLAQQLKAVQDTYDKQKQALDDYWKYKLSTDNLNTETDNIIAKDGLIGALKDVTTYTSQIIAQWNLVQQAKLQALGSSTLAAGLGGAGFIPSGSSTAQLNAYWQKVKAAGGAYANPSGNGMTLQQQIAHEAQLYGIPTSDVKVTASGETFVPWQYVQNHATAASAPSWNSPAAGMSPVSNSNTSSTTVQINGPLQFPNVQTSADVQEFMNALIDQVNAAI